jgi:hypothetical protein
LATADTYRAGSQIDMTPTITSEQRDALYEQILDRLSGIGDVWLAVCSENYEVAGRLGREYSDDLRLVLDDLGWGEGSAKGIELRTPPDVLRRVLSRLHDTALTLEISEAPTHVEVHRLEERTHLVTATCRSVLAELDGE